MIRLLDESVINKIAAGEVIDRPASIVKELMENSIDAGARRILIQAKSGGKESIIVSDDGAGMGRDDAMLCIKRHATSKISTEKDIQSISSLGFRGEALSSIASVSSLCIKTRAESDTAAVLEFGAGRLKSESSQAAPRGTIITVTDIFENVPARKKHLKSVKAELRQIVDVVSAYALINPHIYFQLVHDGASIINAPPSDLLGRITLLFGSRISKKLRPVDSMESDIRVRGYISSPEPKRKDRSMICISVNRRHVRNKTLLDAVLYAYHTLLGKGEYPVAVIEVGLPAGILDVNVHPQKKTIRLSEEARVYDAVFCAVKKGLESDAVPKDLSISSKTAIGRSGAYSRFRVMPSDAQTELWKTQDISSPKDAAAAGTSDKREPQGLETGHEKVQKTGTAAPESIRIIGQAFETYIICQDRQGVILIDQHAAQERVMYERFMELFQAGKVMGQELLSPAAVELSMAEKLVADENRELLKKLGFGIEDFGGSTAMVRRMPAPLAHAQPEAVLIGVLSELRKGKPFALDQRKEESIIRRACRASVKANMRLGHAQSETIIKELFAAKSPMTCPHGRPTMIRLEKSDLEKQFKRSGF